MDGEIKKVLEALQVEWASFRKSNDEELAQIKAKGHADPLLTEQVKKNNEALTALEKRFGELQAQADELTKTAGRRPGGDPASDDAAREKFAREFIIKEAAQGEKRSVKLGLHPESMKSVSIGSDPEGGYAIPLTVNQSIVLAAAPLAPMRGVCGQITVMSEAYKRFSDDVLADSGWVGESDARPETSGPSLREMTPSWGEIYANPFTTQRALDQMTLISAEAWLARAVGRRIGVQENLAFTSGDGVKKPKGILAYTLTATADGTRTFGQIEKLTTASAGNFVADKLLDLVHLLHPAYWSGAVMMTSRLGLAAIRKLKDGDNRYLFQYGTAMAGATTQPGAVPGALLEFPIVLNDAIPVPAADANALIFGNFKEGYEIADLASPAILIRDPYTNKPKVGFYTSKTVGGHVVNDNCFKVLTLSA